MPKKTIRQTKLFTRATASDPMSEAERLIAEARRQNATELDLSFLELTEVPTVLFSLLHLRSLDLSNNRLQRVPTSLGKLQQLQHLDLQFNNLKQLPDALGELRQLRVLILHANGLTNVPASLFALRRLRELYLGNNQLQGVPDELRELRLLQILMLFGNELREVPELSLSNNQLRELSPTIGKLQQLLELDLSFNQLQDVPAALGKCKKLAHLFLHGNSELAIPAEILGATWEAVHREDSTAQLANAEDILDYYFRPKRPLLEAKLILVGRGAVGKTSLVNRLVHNIFGKERKTEGIKITGWDVPLPDGEQAHLNVWDFGGQEIMHATHQFFLTRRACTCWC